MTIATSLSGGRRGAPIVVASHPRSGTHLVIDLLRRQFSGCRVPRGDLLFGREPYWNLDELVISGEAKVGRQIERIRHTRRPLLKTHRRPDFFAQCQFTHEVVPEREEFTRALMADASTIFVYRNVLSAMKSLYAMVEVDGRTPFPDFIRQRRGHLSRVGWWASHIAEWRSAARTLPVRYEALVRDPLGELNRIAAFLGEEPAMLMPILPQRSPSVYLDRLKRLLPIHRESTALGFRSPRPEQVRLTREDMIFIRDEVARIDPDLIREFSLA